MNIRAYVTKNVNIPATLEKIESIYKADPKRGESYLQLYIYLDRLNRDLRQHGVHF